MNRLLSPGARLLGRFGFARKFQLLFLLFMLPLLFSLGLIGMDYRARLAVIAGEQSGVRQLRVLDELERELSAQRYRAARWKAVDILREPTAEARHVQANGTLQDVERQQQQISQIAAAATQLAATSQEVARSCEHASDSARQTRRIAEDSSRDSQRTTDSIQHSIAA